MRRHGVPVLPISQNYYDDLSARFALLDDLIARMTEHSILYDRDDDGELFQIYTMSMVEEIFKEDRFFFEIAQRRGYAGFGRRTRRFDLRHRRAWLATLRCWPGSLRELDRSRAQPRAP